MAGTDLASERTVSWPLQLNSGLMRSRPELLSMGSAFVGHVCSANRCDLKHGRLCHYR